MLDPRKIDLSTLAEALEDHSVETRWSFNRATGEVIPRTDLYEDDDEELEGRDLISIEPIDSRESYRDMAEFIETVRDPRARQLLERAIGGRGAFRRFKDTLFELPELRKDWFGFHDARMARRALEWLFGEELISEETLHTELARYPDPVSERTSGPFDAQAIARAVAADLEKLYGPRLREVVLFGSWARGDAHPESDIDLLVVLDQTPDRWAELARMDDVMWRHSFENATVVTAVPVSAPDRERSSWPLLRRVRVEGTPVFVAERARARR